MSRLIATDTETTGLSSKTGDKIIEIAMVEITRDPNPRTYRQLINPEGREIGEEAFKVHGITAEMLVDQPTFAEALPDILEFIGDGTLVIHNAGFDVEFLRDESMNAGQIWPEPPVIDSMKEAARDFPRSRHGLDALCNRFGIDLSRRTKHGALIDVQLLSELWLAWKGQSGLDLTTVSPKHAIADMETLGALNDLRIRLEAEVAAKPPAPSWAKHFDGISL
jgi:DNA polymerase-3 subunit epsilon